MTLTAAQLADRRVGRLETLFGPGRLVVARDDHAAPTTPITVTALAAPWNVTATLNWWGDTFELVPGSLRAAGPAGHVKFLLDHTNRAFGFASSFESDDEGLWATMHIPREELDDPDVARAVRQMTNGVRDAVSVGAQILEADESPGADRGSTHYLVTSAELLELSSVVIPRFAAARVARIAATRTQGAPAMPTLTPRPVRAGDDPDPDDVDEHQDDGDDDQADGDDGDGGETARAEAHRRATTRAAHAGGPLRRRLSWESFGHYARAVAAGEVDPRQRRYIENALTDVKTGDVTGVLPPQWVTDFAEELAAARPTLSAFETRPLPASGMTITYPVKTVTPPMVARQAAEKTEVESGGFTIAPASTNVVTWAGANDLAVQAIQRSDPDLVTLYLEEMGYQLAEVSDTDVAAQLLAAITQEQGLARDVTAINASLAAAAATVFRARRGAVPNVFVAGLGVWEFLAGASDADGRPLFPNVNGANPVGTLSFTDPQGNVRGLSFYASATLPDAKAIMGWKRAATTWLGPVQTMSADMPSVLGRDVAVYQFGAFACRRPDALVELTLAAPVGAARTASKS